MMKNISLSLLFLCLPMVAMADSICTSGTEAAVSATTPTNQFTFSFDDSEVVTDKKTGLMWARCPIGFQWDGSTCELLEEQRLNWMEALNFVAQNKIAEAPYLSYSDWRLPNIKELASIVERRCLRPAVNQYVFGYTTFAGVSYWSNTHYINSTDIRVVSFYQGSLHSSAITNELYVRLVRDAP